ncbi:4286_t:CDS:2 [Gigaspora rosea]|nr:4286_t:CDS:2 [Gigaspora rosea]
MSSYNNTEKEPISTYSLGSASSNKQQKTAGRPFHPIWDHFNQIEKKKPAFKVPSSKILVGRIFDKQIIQVEAKMENELQNTNYITLALDGWTDPRGRSIWNFLVLTPDQKEHLYALRNYSSARHTAEFLAKEIETIITKIGTKKICAVVSDNGANVAAARRLITQKFPHIMNVSYIANWLNLISNLVLEHEIQVNNIIGGGIKRYITTRWSSYYDTIYSLLRLKVAFIRILEHDPDIISSNEVYTILNQGSFYDNLSFMVTILRPIKKSIVQLESRDSTLADCFIYLIKLAATIYRIPQNQHVTFRRYCITSINRRLLEFNDEIYYLAYFLHPKFRGCGFKKGQYKKIAKYAGTLWSAFDSKESSLRQFLEQLASYKENEPPFNDPFEPDCQTPQT